MIESYPLHNWVGSNPSDDTWNVYVTTPYGATYGGGVQVYSICASS